jgi:hypothetical protein
MTTDDQARADAEVQENTVVDPLDAANSIENGTNELDAYEQEVQAFLNSPEEQGEQPAEGDESESEEAPEGEDTESNEEISGDEETPEEKEEAESKTQERFRFKSDEDKAVAALAKARGITLVQAAKLYAMDLDAPEQKTTTAETAQWTTEATTNRETSADVQARIEELEELETQAFDELELETAKEHRKEANKLRTKLIDLKLAEAQEKVKTEAQAERQFYTDYAASEDKAISFYPDLKDANSAMSKRLAELDAQAAEMRDPNYHSPNKPWILAVAAAKELGVLMKKPDAAPAKKTVQNRPIQPAPGNRGTTSTDANRTFETELDKVETLDDYERLIGRS